MARRDDLTCAPKMFMSSIWFQATLYNEVWSISQQRHKTRCNGVFLHWWIQQSAIFQMLLEFLESAWSGEDENVQNNPLRNYMDHPKILVRKFTIVKWNLMSFQTCLYISASRSWAAVHLIVLIVFLDVVGLKGILFATLWLSPNLIPRHLRYL